AHAVRPHGDRDARADRAASARLRDLTRPLRLRDHGGYRGLRPGHRPRDRLPGALADPHDEPPGAPGPLRTAPGGYPRRASGAIHNLIAAASARGSPPR